MAKTRRQHPIICSAIFGRKIAVMTPSPNPPPARIHRIMDSQAEAREAIHSVLAHARMELMIFDQSPASLTARGLGSPENIEIIRQLLLGGRTGRPRRMRIALHEIQGIEGEIPRLMSLLDQFSDLLTIRRTAGDARNVQDVLLIADDDAVWRKPVASHPRSIVTLHDANEVKPYLDRFAEIWQLSADQVSSRHTGL